MAANKKKYSKPPLNEEELVDRLIARGLDVPDKQRACRYLKHIGYYRLSPYSLPLQTDRKSHTFRPGTTFDDILNLYVFDRKLRLLVTDALERAEVAVRAALSNTMSLSSPEDAFWYLRPERYCCKKAAAEQAKRIIELTQQHRNWLSGKSERADALHHPDAIHHYLTKYDTPATPPSWLVVELLTLGELQHLYSALPGHSKKKIAKSLGLTEPVLTSWLKSYVRVRNICAHHGRLWNRFLGVYPKIPTSETIPWLHDRSVFATNNNNALERKRLYPVLVSLQTILFTISPHSTWATRLNALLAEHPTVPLDALGMTPGWHQDQFWMSAFKAAEPSRQQT